MNNFFQPKLEMYVAETMLREYFNESSSHKREMSALKLFCQEVTAETAGIRPFLFRITLYEVHHVLVGSVIKSLEPEKQQYLRLKYSTQKKVSGQAMALHVSHGQLNLWKRKIMEKIIDATSFHLTCEDVFFRNKIINMLEALATILAVIAEIDPNYEFVDSFWANACDNHYNNYRRLLDNLDECLQYPHKNNMNKIISILANHPNATREELAAMCNCTTTTVTRYMNIYIDSVKKYIYLK